MSSDLEVRIKLPHSIHQKWSNAASIRGLSLKAFVAATVSGELIRTGELVVTSVTPPAATKAKPGEYVYDPNKTAVATDWNEVPDFSHLDPKRAPKHSPWDDEEDDTEDYERAKMPSTITKVTPPENLTSLVETWPDADDEE
jgi:hypothetical protein